MAWATYSGLCWHPVSLHTTPGSSTFQPMCPSPTTEDSSRSSSATSPRPTLRTQGQQTDFPLTWEQSTPAGPPNRVLGAVLRSQTLAGCPSSPRAMTAPTPLSGVRLGSQPRSPPLTPSFPTGFPPVSPCVSPRSVCPQSPALLLGPRGWPLQAVRPRALGQ